MTIHVDASDKSFVAWCSDCPSWRALTLSRAEALAAGSVHLTACHDAALEASRVGYRARQLRGG